MQRTEGMKRLCARSFALVGLGVLALATTGSGAAVAGACPADKVVAQRELPDRATAPRAVTDRVLSAIPLGDQAVRAEGYQLRLRRLVIEPGGVVPWHEHDSRPAIIYVVEGQIVENSNTCAVPIVHRAGEVAQESRGLGHWWRNNSQRRVVLLSADILPPAADANMM